MSPPINANGTSANTNTVVVTATPTITWTGPASITYGTALGSAQLDATASVAGTFVYTPAAGTVLHAGSNQTLSVVFTPTDTTDYTHATATTTISVSQATPTITWASPASHHVWHGAGIGPARCDCVGGRHVRLYSGRGHGPPCRRQSDAVRTVHAHRYDRLHDRERHDDDQRLAGDTDDHLDGPASITYGTALGSAQLDASASVAGTFAYTPAAGTVLHAGDNQTLSVLFTPTDTTDYTTASATTTISVSQATPTITWTGPASITYGTALGSAQLDASASVAGTFAYTPAAGTVLACRRQSDAVRTVHAHRYDRLHDRDRHDDDQRLASDTGDHLAWPGVDHVWHGAGISPARCECVGGRHVCLYSGGGHGPPCRRQSDAVRTVHAHRFDRLHDRDRHDDDQRLAGDTDDHLAWPGVDHVWHRAGIGPARCERVGGRHVCLYSGGGHGPRCR